MPSIAPVLLAALVSFGASPGTSAAQLKRTLPDSLTDREFWQLFTTVSEEGGTFSSENFVSNEQTYQHVIPTLKRTLAPGGVYLGVGPEQNFTYIANLKPRMAVIFDIRRQNAMAHLMYKAIFELSPTRADFVAHLFSRSLPKLAATVTPAELFAAVANAPMNDSAFEANRFAIIDRLTVAHGFALTPDDLRSINHVYAAFFEAGPDINYGYRASMRFGPTYVTFAQLQNLTNADGVNMAFLAAEESYQVVRAMHAKNLIVPVVGDFAGPKAIRGVGEYLKQRGASVSAFYLSNVEQYLFRNLGDAERFYRNVEMLPVDSTSSFIRSVPNGALGMGLRMFGSSSITASMFGGPTNSYSVRVVDSGGVNVIWTTIDSAGKSLTTRTVDSSNTRRSALDIFRSLRARDDSVFRARFDSAQRASGGGTRVFGRDTVPALGVPPGSVFVGGAGSLASGLASIRASLDAFNTGRLRLYEDVTLMTKISGWK